MRPLRAMSQTDPSEIVEGLGQLSRSVEQYRLPRWVIGGGSEDDDGLPAIAVWSPVADPDVTVMKK